MTPATAIRPQSGPQCAHRPEGGNATPGQRAAVRRAARRRWSKLSLSLTPETGIRHHHHTKRDKYHRLRAPGLVATADRLARAPSALLGADFRRAARRQRREGHPEVAAALEHAAAGLGDGAERELRTADRIAKVRRALASCGKTWARGTCVGGRGTGCGAEYAVRQFCGRAGCGCAGTDRRQKVVGPLLERRAARALPRLGWCETWAVMELTTNTRHHAAMRSQAALDRLYAATWAALAELQPWREDRRTGAPGALVVAHPFGDKCDDQGRIVWKPHGNAVAPLPVGTRYKVSKYRIRRARVVAARVLGLPASDVQVHYGWRTGKGKQSHALRYRLRDTAAGKTDRIPDDDLRLVWAGFHRMRWVRWFGQLGTRTWASFQRRIGLDLEAEARKRWQQQDDAEGRARKSCAHCAGSVRWTQEREPEWQGPSWENTGPGCYARPPDPELLAERKRERAAAVHAQVSRSVAGLFRVHAEPHRVEQLDAELARIAAIGVEF